jgi:hypothetical protein
LAQTYNLHIDAGATFNLNLRYRNQDGSLYDLTGYTASLQVRKTATSSTAVVSVTPSINVATSVISVNIPAATTSTLTDSPYVWALELHSADESNVIRLVEGLVIVSPEVVR